MFVVVDQTDTELVVAVLLDVTAEIIGRAGGLNQCDLGAAPLQLDLILFSAFPLLVPMRGLPAPPAVAPVSIRRIGRTGGT